MSEAAVAAAPAASSPAPASAPSSAPVSTPAAAPVSTPVSTPAQPNFGGGSGVTSHVDPSTFGTNTQAYAKAILDEQLAAIPAVDDAGTAAATEADAVADPQVPPATEEPIVAPEVPAPDAVVEEKPEVTEEPDFELEPAGIVTPEALTQMVTDNPEFGKLLEADARLKGQLYKTAREAAELKPYREIFPDLESAKTAVADATTFNDVRETFMGSTTREGTLKTLARLAELSYERDETGNVLMQDGQPVIGEDLHGFLDNVWAIEMEDRKSTIQGRLEANQYHVGAKSQEEAQAAYDRDAARLAFFDDVMGQVVEAPETEQLPPHLREKAAEIERREKALNEKQHGEKVGERQKFETTMQSAATERLNNGIGSILSNVKKQGGVISPYLEKILPQAIASKVVAKIVANPVLKSQMDQLQKLPMSDEAKTRRLAAIDRAYQMYLPEVAREELREAGVQLIKGANAKLEKIDEQAANTQKTELRGSRTAAAQRAPAPMSPQEALEYVQAKWQKANPGKVWDRAERDKHLQEVVNLQLHRF